jgi:hypothetical protein
MNTFLKVMLLTAILAYCSIMLMLSFTLDNGLFFALFIVALIAYNWLILTNKDD